MSPDDNSLALLRAFLAAQQTLTLATSGPGGTPQAADVYYAETDDLGLYFVSLPGSRHAANIARDPHVAATVHADSTRWRDIRGVQLEGTCARVSAAERVAAYARYTAKFPFVLADAALARALQKVDMYHITPRWLRWIDNSLGLGHNREWILADNQWQMVGSPE
jgi:uncharacterized protein YhbP (UPF0306 family)